MSERLSSPVSEPLPVEFALAAAPVREAVTKLGGQPVWLEEPQWPLSRRTGEPLQFLGQFTLDGGALGYLFMADGDAEGTFEPEGGENALLIQPGGRTPDFVSVRAQAEGPTVGADHLPRPAGAGGTDPDGHAWQFLGGPGIEPRWLQGEETPGEGWRLLVQLDSGRLPFTVDFGDSGVGYAFTAPDAKEGRFLWQCL
ncbi:hypothetical protein NGF19_04530 [Streptomyces sp. RY43-2]|uniref:DUF1963 domain-containing protein n=1 Tax=Streptomyces macrolidinus TaxID=2952607 RepID=A0ABT0Z9Y3_9ACTN|nr:hypothetical protein [Streptomyces macrolidinus]MCN9240062.1 hypothetical protein [Streptomyces macrolidinus]